ncbi:MAG TPA: sigma-70 family RNA polymerase sigma factor [Stenotrophomonas sp.]|jgi:RNA polymerase sigma-70 factor (ECF subfamily)|uniref:RNA polymerase sigma factor n=1 Tax=Stenotrophomonas TaxID=40323 RepID=UPI0008A384F2|nr:MULTISPECIES: sigma-70 family RNA polymerase sigma factor [unclassified Stenotrophomonas]MBW8375631.1 sigma-70 family RNA polymerase sigma factor [Stenotrophomonas sp.]OFS91607.1 RNA polymerase subunit sigma-24 [Stenotrophomonas sp. HMSC10F06]HAV71025.1 sigma-70 family RNA polymerase sigma factor [Stenotrophomonas sp.]
MRTSPPPPADCLDADRLLVAAILSRQPGAFEQLVREYQGLCWRVVDRMVRHPEDTRELCQEAFLRIHQTLHQYRGESALKSWVAQVAYSIAKRHLERRRIPLVENTVSDDGTALIDRVGDGIDLEALTSEQDINAHLHAAIDALPPLQRTLLSLYHLEEISIAEIAILTELAEGTIKSHLFRSRKRLRELLESRIGVPA